MITLKRNKGSALTHDELDDNFDGSVNKFSAQSIDGVKTFNSSPIVPTLAPGDDTTKVATTAFVTKAITTRASILTMNTVVPVGPTQTYTTINDVLDYYGNFIPANGVTLTIELQDNFVMAEQVLIEARNFGWMTIQAKTPTKVYTVDVANITTLYSVYGGNWTPNSTDEWRDYAVLFFIKDNAVSPKIKCRFEAVYPTDTTNVPVGIMVHNNSQASIHDNVTAQTFSDFNGFTNFYCNAMVHDNSKLNAVHCNFSDTSGVSESISDLYYSECGLFISDNSLANVENSTFVNCNYGIFSVSSIVNAEQTILGNITSGNITTTSAYMGVYSISSRVTLTGAIVNDTTGTNVYASSSDLNCLKSSIDNSDSHVYEIEVYGGSIVRGSSINQMAVNISENTIDGGIFIWTYYGGAS